MTDSGVALTPFLDKGSASCYIVLLESIASGLHLWEKHSTSGKTKLRISPESRRKKAAYSLIAEVANMLSRLAIQITTS
jgi:hypothetical protein